jgi:hypothetical protein
MKNISHKQQERESSSDQERNKIAVPYIPPPPPDESVQKRFRSPLVNGVILSLTILVFGFMIYNYVGNQFTKLSADTTVNTSTQSPSPTVSPTPTPSVSPSK